MPVLGGVGVINFAIGAGTIVNGAALGGLSEELAGGSFWDGVRNGAISAALNHVAHMIQESIWSQIGDPIDYREGEIRNYTRHTGFWATTTEKQAIFKGAAGQVIFPGVNFSAYYISGGGVTFWNGSIYASRDMSLADLQHEYGHHLDNTRLGYGVYAGVMIFSGLSMARDRILGTFDHDNFWTEKRIS